MAGKSTSRVRTPTVLQMEAVECAAAALGIVLAHFGKHVTLAELRRECGVSRDGSNAASLLKAARRYGLECNGFSLETDQLLELSMPCIVFWNFNHFLVVEGVGADHVHVNDPAVGHRKVPRAEFDESFTGVVLTVEPGPDFVPSGRRPQMLPALRERLTGFRSALWFSLLTGFLLVVPGLAVPAFTQVFVDEVLIHDRSEWLRPLVLGLAIAIVFQFVLKALQLRGLRRLHIALAARMSATFFRHLLRLPVDFYSQRFAGEISNRGRLNDKVAQVLSGQLAQTAIDVVMMSFYAALMVFYDLGLTLIGIGFAALNYVALRGMSRWRVEANMRQLQEYGKVTGASIAGLQNIETIKASGLESGFFHRWSGHFANAANVRQSIATTNQILGLLPSLLSSLTTMLILVLGGLHVIDGSLSIGSLVAFQMLMVSFLRPIGNLVHLGQTIQELHGDLARLDDVLAHDVDPLEADRTKDDDSLQLATTTAAPQVRLRGELHLEHVTFGYSPADPPLIRDFDLHLEPGQRVALVGGSGSGKSTIAKLVCGLYEPWSGRILFDGKSRTEIPRHRMNHSLAMVDQDILFFGGSLRDNLTLWDDSIPDHVLWAACEDAEIRGRLQRVPGGLAGEVSEGASNFSGGERQRLEIARALVSNPSILVLDEATNALDAESERQIMEHLALRGCTCLLVAHRLSTIRDCDEIIVLEGGAVVERGTHDELWEMDGAYAALLRSDEGANLEVVG